MNLSDFSNGATVPAPATVQYVNQNVPVVQNSVCADNACVVGPTNFINLDPAQFANGQGNFATINLTNATGTTQTLFLGGTPAQYMPVFGINNDVRNNILVTDNFSGLALAVGNPLVSVANTGAPYVQYLDQLFNGGEPALICSILVTADTFDTAAAQFNQRATTYSFDYNADQCARKGQQIACSWCDNSNSQPLIRQYVGCPLFPVGPFNAVAIPIVGLGNPQTPIPTNITVEIRFATDHVVPAWANNG